MSTIHKKVVEAAKKINLVVGAEGYEDLILEYTEEFLASLSKDDNERRLVFDFMSMASCFNVPRIVEYMVENAYPTELLELGMNVIQQDIVNIITDFTEKTLQGSETTEIKEHKLMFLYANACRLWPHMDLELARELAEFLDDDEDIGINGERMFLTEFLLNTKVFEPGLHEWKEIKSLLDVVLKTREWNIYARVFLKYPALIKFLSDKNVFKVKETLADNSEKNRPLIEKFVSEIYTTHPMDLELHSWIIALFNNPYVLECFTNESNKSAEALAELDMFKKMHQPQTTE